MITRDKSPHTRGLSPIDRFFTKVHMTQTCWIWTGSARVRKPLSAPVAKFKEGGRWVNASRWIWVYLHGPLPQGMQVLHRCDNPQCVNPTHFFIGTQLDNIRDMQRKGRARGVSRPGEKSPSAKLSLTQVRQIISRRAIGQSLQILSDQFQISKAQISRIINHQRWGKAL